LLFTSRETYLEAISDWIKSERKIFSICGLGGVGKTAIALEAAWRLQTTNPNICIFWLRSNDYNSGENSHILDDSITNLATELNLTNTHIDDLLFFFKSLNDKFLVVIDNLDQEKFSPTAIKLLKGNWLQNKNAKLLITTRLESSSIENFYKETFKISALKVDCLSDEEGGKMIEELVGVKSPNGEAKRISNLLGGLTLALKHSAGIITSLFNKDFKRFLKELQKNKLKMLDEEPGQEKSNVVRGLAAEIQLLETHCPKAIFVLRSLAFYSHHFCQNLIEEFFEEPEVKKILEPEKLSQLEIRKALSNLKKFHLIEESNYGFFKIHCLLSEIIRKGTPASEQSRFERLGHLMKIWWGDNLSNNNLPNDNLPNDNLPNDNLPYDNLLMATTYQQGLSATTDQ
jgi:hypothetical protein